MANQKICEKCERRKYNTNTGIGIATPICRCIDDHKCIEQEKSCPSVKHARLSDEPILDCENTNGMVEQEVPKGCKIDNCPCKYVSKEELYCRGEQECDYDRINKATEKISRDGHKIEDDRYLKAFSGEQEVPEDWKIRFREKFVNNDDNINVWWEINYENIEQFISKEISRARDEGYEAGLNIRKEYNNLSSSKLREIKEWAKMNKKTIDNKYSEDDRGDDVIYWEDLLTFLSKQK